jgi:hypothetical protein
MIYYTSMTQTVAQHKMIFNGQRMVQRIIKHEGYTPVVVASTQGTSVAIVKPQKEDKKADRARIAAELFKTL